MIVLNQIIDEKAEIIYEFFEENLNQLRFYEEAFKNIEHNEILIVESIKSDMQNKYILNYKLLLREYNFIKKDINVRNLSKCLNILKKTDNNDFRVFLSEFIEYFNFFLYEDYLNNTYCSKF